ncbi:MAG: DUF2330 domain-containing protein, partial [Planctomycetes bacterium]|nr:DUF2330 domain-containing protein [Planctomycetota bacterium]
MGSEVVYGDGKFIPLAVTKTVPAIPSQRAILVYREGVETLVIESTLEGEGEEFGWVIPLPSKPTDFAKVSPGLIKTMSLVLQPEITDDKSQTVSSSARFFLVVLILVIFRLASRGWKLYAKLLSLLVIMIFCFFLFIPTMGKTFGGGVNIQGAVNDGVEVVKFEQVGSYDVAVLDVEEAAGLGGWLEGEGFAGLTVEDREIVSDYIAEGWCFVATKLRREGEGYSEPHPLAMTFACEQAVYPMRLTGTVGNDVYLELFVVAEKRAEYDRLVLEVTDRFKFKQEMYEDRYSDKFAAGYSGNFFWDIRIGHAEGQKYLWDGCVVSKLAGKLAPVDMEEDIIPKWSDAGAYQRHYYSSKG